MPNLDPEQQLLRQKMEEELRRKQDEYIMKEELER